MVSWVNNRAADAFVHCHADFNDKQQESWKKKKYDLCFSFHCAPQLNNMPFNANECAENYAKQHERERAPVRLPATRTVPERKVTLQRMKRLINRKEEKNNTAQRIKKYTNKSLRISFRLKSELCKQTPAHYGNKWMTNFSRFLS